jgi:prefoldin alpha subunit
MDNSYMELQMLGQQAQQLRQHLENIDVQMQELAQTKQSLHELKECKTGSNMLSQVATGMFVRGKLENANNVILNIGAEVGVEKTLKEAQEMIDKQLTEVTEIREHFLTQFNQMRDRMVELQQKQT